MLYPDILFDTPAKETSPYPIFIALYLAVLALFIVLYSMSEKDMTKSHQATESISRTFNKATQQGVYLPDEMIFHNYFALDELQRQLQNATDGSLDKDSYVIGQYYDRYWVIFPTQHFFYSAETELKRTKQKFFQAIAHIMTAQQTLPDIRCVITIYIPRSSEENYTLAIKQNISRLGKIIRLLQSYGVSADKITTSLQQGSVDAMAIELVTSGRER